MRTATVEYGPLASEVRASGVAAFPETSRTDISARVDGWVRGLGPLAVGGTVRKDDPLFVLSSPTLLAIEDEFVAALRGRALTEQTTVPEVRAHTEQLIDMVRNRLLLLGMSANEVRELERRGRALGELSFTAPAAGVVIEKDVVDGAYVTAGQRLLRLASASSIWVEVGVHERDLGTVAVGRQATVAFDAFPGETFRARVTSLGPSLSADTRTLTVRLELANTSGRIRPGMYATATIGGAARDALTVPADALIDSGSAQVVFLAEGEGFFDPTPVRIGRRLGDRVEILAGLEAGQRVASGATFFIDSESQLQGALRDYEAGPAANTGTPAGASAPDRGATRLTIRVTPDPPGTGPITVEAALTEQGAPVTDAAVRVVVSMPAMPSMGMGAMRSESRLPHAGRGVYSGRAEIPHAGRWDVTAIATRGDRTLASVQRSLLVP